jgi:hypothetical protein
MPVTPSSADAPYYRYDPHLGSPRDRYTRVDFLKTATHHPEMGGRFVAVVEGEFIINSMRGRRAIHWRADPGTPCLILGYWSDGTVHLKWPAINGYYMIDGRFPAWVVEEDPEAALAHGGFILRANELLPAPARLAPSFVWLGLVVVIVVLMALLLVRMQSGI